MYLPKHFPKRLVFVPGWGNPYHVPWHIVRVDSARERDIGKVGTHGWQVRYAKPSRFFSDSVGGKLRTPAESLQDAAQYLASIYKGPRNRCRTTPTKRAIRKIVWNWCLHVNM